MSNTQAPIWRRWGQFRFPVIGELLSSPPAKGQLQEEIQRLSQKIYQHPIDENRKFTLGASTIERWYYKAKVVDNPVVVLGRKLRSDAGIRWAMPEALLDALKTQYHTYPRWTVQLHYDNLNVVVQENPKLGKLPSYKTVLRCMRDNGWWKSREPASLFPGKYRLPNTLKTGK